MALKTMEAFELGVTDGILEASHGPNDWDMWLCLRGTNHEVSFFTNQPVRFPPFRDEATFFSGRITMLARRPDDMRLGVWRIEGFARKGMDQIPFKGTYSTESRTGEFRFRNE